jgi:hypothetical protein
VSARRSQELRTALSFALTLAASACGAREALPDLPQTQGSGAPAFPGTTPDASSFTSADGSAPSPGQATDAGDAAAPDSAPPPSYPVPVPPWEIDGGDLPDGCAGQTLSSGACLLTLASGQQPSGIAIDSANVYWTNTDSTGASAVVKVPRTGGSPVTLATGASFRGLTVDETNAYVDGRAITAVNLQTGATTTLFDDGNSFTQFVTRAGPRVYWADSDFRFALSSCLPDGSGRVDLAGPSTPIGGLAATPTGVVFSETSDTTGVGESLVSATFDGNKTTLIGGAPGDLGMVKVGGDVIVFNDGFRTLYSMPLSGGPPVFLASDAYATDLVTDGSDVYWTDGNLRAVRRLHLAAGAPEVLVSNNDTPVVYGQGFLTIDSRSVYFTDSGRVMELTPR